VDVNVPPSESSVLESDWFNRVASQLERLEKNPQTSGLPPAIVFFTNFPYHFMESGNTLKGQTVVFRGFNVPEFHVPSGGSRAAVEAKFAEVLALFDSVLRHTQVPHELN